MKQNLTTNDMQKIPASSEALWLFEEEFGLVSWFVQHFCFALCPYSYNPIPKLSSITFMYPVVLLSELLGIYPIPKLGSITFIYPVVLVSELVSGHVDKLAYRKVVNSQSNN